ncbi:hypothetical protein EGD00_14610 [Pectobacterium carotovorum subsp. carotovorum]|nr:hypothetical protein EGD00_14610 [Pectobacterium carotovorum subsp. carotovorum]
MVEEEDTGKSKAVGYHTSMESGRDQVRVRLLKYDFPNNRYEFWEEGQPDQRFYGRRIIRVWNYPRIRHMVNNLLFRQQCRI